ncbi:hypothetical protein HPB49_007847 [Dermacentor silvarum]|uniref:Uncharacterized protein n=1 Tax=Dermacentor silvarum TaxID=543639 RepID=A0ACB8C879_DERSI|nr:hypothetical protein HPB49_007847 [Dermacentor silvarum]
MSLSKFLCASVPYNCYEIGHTWTPHCSQAWFDVWYNTFTRAVKLYGVLYLVGQLVARRHGRRAFMQTLRSTFDSSMFISQNFFLYLALVCICRQSTGRLHLMQSTLLCGFISSACAITIERPARHLIGKEELVGYAQLEAKLALKEAELLKAPGDVDKLVRLCDVTPITETPPLITCNGNGHAYANKVGGKVRGPLVAVNGTDKHHSPRAKSWLPLHGVTNGGLVDQCACDHGSALRVLSSVFGLLKERHCTCRHQYSCLANFFKVALKFGSVGWAAGVGFSVLKGYRKIRIRQLLSGLLLGPMALRTGCFLGGLTGFYSLSSCVLRWFSGGQRDWHGLVAGTAGGLACAVCPSSYVSLYLLWKLIELVYLKSAEQQLVPKFEGAAVWLYAVCTSIMLYVAILEPHNLRPQYRKFLDDISGRLMSQINRFPLDMLGLHSSQAFPHYSPLNLDRRHITRQYLQHVLIWL